jgi:hypothetical protein
MEGENEERNNRCPNETGHPIVNETQNYWVEGVTLGVIPIMKPIHGRCLNKLLKNTTDPSELERLSRSLPIEERRRNLTCYFCHEPISHLIELYLNL